jgi:hypothetical protein
MPIVKMYISWNCQGLPKISGLDRFLDLHWDFWDWKVVSRQKSRFPDCRDKLFENVKIFLTGKTYILKLFISRVLIETTLRQIDLIETYHIWTRQLRLALWKCHDFRNCRDLLFETFEIESLHWDQVETNLDPTM